MKWLRQSTRTRYHNKVLIESNHDIIISETSTSFRNSRIRFCNCFFVESIVLARGLFMFTAADLGPAGPTGPTGPSGPALKKRRIKATSRTLTTLPTVIQVLILQWLGATRDIRCLLATTLPRVSRAVNKLCQSRLVWPQRLTVTAHPPPFIFWSRTWAQPLIYLDFGPCDQLPMFTLSQLPSSLRILKIKGTAWGFHPPHRPVQLPKLRALSIMGDFKNWSRLPKNLASLELFVTSHSSTATLQALLKRAPQLKRLSLGKFDGQDFMAGLFLLRYNFEELTHLGITIHNRRAWRHLQHLTRLKHFQCSNMSLEQAVFPKGPEITLFNCTE